MPGLRGMRVSRTTRSWGIGRSWGAGRVSPTLQVMRAALILLSVLVGVLASSTAPAGAEPTTMPDLRGYT
ncbi:MAG: hypothetical protein QOK02_2704, partial [Mycobacterium sp.]|nr:hypothetical protein [Mycobacterium sp.]